MDFDFAPTFNRQPSADLIVYGSMFNGNSKPNSEKRCALSCQFTRQITTKMGWVKGDRVTAKWSHADKSLTFSRVGVDDPDLAYKISFYPPKKKESHARVRLGCPKEAIKVILDGKIRATFSFFEATGSTVTFVANA
jgi:hypothetical protein